MNIRTIRISNELLHNAFQETVGVFLFLCMKMFYRKCSLKGNILLIHFSTLTHWKALGAHTHTQPVNVAHDRTSHVLFICPAISIVILLKLSIQLRYNEAITVKPS